MRRHLKVLTQDRNEDRFKSPHTKRGEVQPATNHATSCDPWQVLAADPNPQWQRRWLQNLALFYRKGNDAIHQHAVFDRWLRRFAQRCSCRACCAGGRLVCGGDNVETMMVLSGFARARRRHRWKVVFGVRLRELTQHGCCCCTFGASRRSAMRRGLISLLLFLLLLCVDKLTRLCC